MPAEASPLKQKLLDDVKTAMRAKDKIRLGTLRLITAGIKQVEVDERLDLSDEDVLVILTKMCKQRRDSIAQYEKAGRNDLADIEVAELKIIAEFMPEALSDEEIDGAIQAAISESGASSARDMGAVMKVLRPKIQGRADMGAVSGRVKAALTS